jgi:chromosome segregation ATPase
MAKVSISKAAELAGISRKHLYEKYINQGLISVSRENEAKPVIDTAEILRVFGRLHSDKNSGNNQPDPENSMLHNKVTGVTPEIYELRTQIASLTAKYEGAGNLIQELKDQLDRERNRLSLAEQRALSAENQVKGLLEDHRKKEADTQRLATLERQQEELLTRLQYQKGFWQRVRAVFTG